ncbi:MULTISPECIES: barstar family protein [unclassified Rathayibacter]|uniref:barstar family protein n=1 Tax=unclassified Rathayibacter TaxID=2609250 RepID=UPI00188D7C30|nr:MULTISPECIES: barstar family protein [unclassified Rathayibacter]MBF4463196.1 barstar family protein [Rathayibacter sp. VKM Ac-2879]MBF4504567.1 barstar family protein [Rathayibacter sp. VKM Ac-2878]
MPPRDELAHRFADLEAAIESAVEDGGLVRLDGRAMRTADDLWEHYGHHFSFPTPGENRPAFHEYIRDLAWFQAFSYLTVIEHATFVLAGEPAERATFRRLLSRHRAELGEQPGEGIPIRLGVPFRCARQCSDPLTAVSSRATPVTCVDQRDTIPSPLPSHRRGET